jgi:hypothetical protein
MAENYHPDIQKALSEGRINPKQAKWMDALHKTPGNPKIGTSGVRDGASEKMMNYMKSIKSGQSAKPDWMGSAPQTGKAPAQLTGKVDLDREGLKALDKMPAILRKAFGASEYSNTYADSKGGSKAGDLNYYNELLKVSKESPNYKPYSEEIAKLKERNPEFKKGGKVSSASNRGDGIAQRGKTKGRYL